MRRNYFRCAVGWHRRVGRLCARCGRDLDAPVYRVRSAESRNAGADIPGAAADAARLGRKARP